MPAVRQHPSNVPAAGRDGREPSPSGRGGQGVDFGLRGREMTCTSIGPASRITWLMIEPWDSSAHRDRRLAPSTSWVAFSRPGEVDKGPGHVERR